MKYQVEYALTDGVTWFKSVREPFDNASDAILFVISRLCSSYPPTQGVRIANVSDLPSSEDLDVVAAEQKAKEATNG